MKDQILLFNANDEDIIKKMQMALAIHRIKIKKVEISEYNQTIGYLAGVKEASKCFEPYDGEELPSPMVVFCFSRQLLDQVLRSFQNMDVPRIPHKAMMTVTNQNWTPGELYLELTKELMLNQQSTNGSNME